MSKKFLLCFFMLFYVSGSSTGTLEWEWQHYTSKPSLKTQLIDYVFLKWDQKTDFYKGPFYFDSHIQAEYNFDRSEIFYFNIPELYFFYKYDMEKSFYFIDSIELNVGRKIKDWSLADEYWDMGLWNPLTRWNPLHPVTNGLTGAFLYLESSRWSVDVFLGALHLPGQEAQFIEKNGEAYSRSRWFFPLPDEVDQLNIDIDYFTRTPFIFDVLFQPSYLLSLKTWSKTLETDYWMKWSIADKPVNHLFFVLNKENLYRIGKEKGAVGNINQNITTLPVRQRILSAEWGLDYRDFSAVFTLENTKMKEVAISPEGWDFTSQRENFTYFSALFKYNLSDFSHLFKDNFLSESFIQFAYIQSWFRNYNFNGKNKGKPPSILRRYKVLEGIGVDWQTEFLSSGGLRRVFTLNYRYFFVNRGGWLFAKTLYYIAPDTFASMEINVLGAKGDIDYFFNRFRHNDYFSWSLAYEF